MLGSHLKHFAAGLLLAATLSTTAWADEQLGKIENAYQAADTARLTSLVETTQGENQFVAQYRLVSLMMSSNQMDKAKVLLNDLKNGLVAETNINPDNAEAWALLASTYGMLTTVEREKTTEYGTEAGIAEASALATGLKNPMVMQLIGINKFYTPEEWGGGKTRALEFFDRAVTAYQAGDLKRTWGYADALVWRATIHSQLGNQAQAKADVDAAAVIAPDYQRVQSALGELQ